MNWLKKKNKNYTWVAGGSWKKYDGWDYGKIAFIISIIILLILIVQIVI